MSRVRGVRPTRADLPTLQAKREALASIIARVDRWRAPESKGHMKLAWGLVRDQLAQECRGVEELIAYAQRERQPGCRGGTPAVMGHGCPALVSAVGPAPTVSQGHATGRPADPLLLGPVMQELPVAGPALPVNIFCAEGVKS